MNSETLIWLLLVISVGLNGWLIGDKIKQVMWKRRKRKGGGYSGGGSNRRPARKRAPRSRYDNWPKGSKPASRRDEDDDAPRPGAPF